MQKKRFKQIYQKKVCTYKYSVVGKHYHFIENKNFIHSIIIIKMHYLCSFVFII